MLTRLIAVLSILALAGCSAPASKAIALRGQDAAQQAKDADECDTRAGKESGERLGGAMGSTLGPAIGRNTSKGYLLAGISGVQAAKDAQEIYDKCMAERGYTVAQE